MAATTSNLVWVELCRRVLDGCTIVERRQLTEQEAKELLSKQMVNGYFWRRQPKSIWE